MSRRDFIREKILSRVHIDEQTGCWLWTGPTSGKEGRGAGYPRMSLGGQTVAVHLVMWTNEHGYIPGKKEIDHFLQEPPLHQARARASAACNPQAEYPPAVGSPQGCNCMPGGDGMTASAIVKKSDLDRMAIVANEKNVTVEIVEVGGRIIRVSPAAHAQGEKSQLAPRGGVRL